MKTSSSSVEKHSLAIRFSFILLLLGQVCLRFLQKKISYRSLLEQMIKAGPTSMIPVLLVTGFAGMIFTLQTARELVRFGAVNFVGGAFALAFCRELAPILSASILAGQVGSAFAAEIGAMKISEQIDALYLLKTNPIDFLVVPRVIACCLMLPILTIFGLIIGIIGGVFAATLFYDLTPTVFLNSVRNFLTLSDLISILLKGIIFGIMIAVISCGWGLTTVGGVKEVGESATAAVVTSWVSIFIVDFFLSLMLFGNPAI